MDFKIDIRDVALKYLASRARTCGEMKKHLKSKEFSDQEIAEVIENLKELHYLDDMDYCSQYFDYAFGKGKGYLRAKRELEEKGVDREMIEIAFDEYENEETELKRAERQAAKVAEGRQVDDKLLGKIGRRLTTMGYSSDVVYQVVGMYMRQKDE